MNSDANPFVIENEEESISEILKYKKRQDGKTGKANENKKEEDLFSFDNLIEKHDNPPSSDNKKPVKHQKSIEEYMKPISKEEQKTQKVQETKKKVIVNEPANIDKSAAQDKFYEQKNQKTASNKKTSSISKIINEKIELPKDLTEKYEIIIGCKFCDLIHINKSKLIYEDDQTAAFHDKRKSSAKEHVLVCSKRHIKNVAYVTKPDIPLIVYMEEVGRKVLARLDSRSEYRFGYHEPPMNSVEHLHLHCFVLPITNNFLNKVIYGFKLAPTTKIVEKALSRPTLEHVTVTDGEDKNNKAKAIEPGSKDVIDVIE